MRRPRALCTLEAVKRLLPNYQEPADTTERANADALILDLVDAASQRISETAGREFVSNEDPGTQTGDDWPAPPPATRSFDVSLFASVPVDPATGARSARQLKVGDLASFQTLAYGDPWTPASRYAVAATSVRPLPLVRKPWEPIRRLEVYGNVWNRLTYDVTGVWGFPAVPPDIRQACAEQAAIWVGRDLRNFSRAFLDAAAAGGAPPEPRSLAQAIYDTAVAYDVPELG